MKRTCDRVRVRALETIDERYRRVKPWRQTRTAIIGFSFTLTLAFSGALLSNDKIPNRDTLFAIGWAAFASAALGAQLLLWSASTRPGHREGIRGGQIVHLAPRFGPMMAAGTFIVQRALSGLLIAGFAITLFWVAMAALGARLPEPIKPETIAAQVPAPATLEPSPQLSGAATIVDGDTFDIGATRLRPLGYDTPEEGKKCKSAAGTVNIYTEASRTLSGFVGGKALACVDTGARDQHHRIIVTCTVGLEDLGELMVASGWARDWPRYSGGRYCEAERDARAAKRGIWALTCPVEAWDGRDYVDPQTGKECADSSPTPP